MYKELLELCGFEPEEIELERPRVDKAFKIAGIGRDDCKLAEVRIRKYFDLELQGIRKILGIWVREFVDMVLAKEEGKKIVYGIYPTFPTATQAVMEASEDIYMVSPEVIIDVVMGQIFDKINPILEEAERCGLEPGRANCSLLQARLGAIAKGIIPMPDLLFCTRFFCDQAQGIDELIHQVYDIPVTYTDRPLDQNWDEWPDVDEREVKHLGSTLTRSFKEVGKIVGCEITPEHQNKGIAETLRKYMGYIVLAQLIKDADPIPLSMVDHFLCFLAAASPLRRTKGELTKVFNLLNREVKERIDKGQGVVERGAPRVLVNISSFTDPSITYMMEREMGLAIPMHHYGWFIPGELERLTARMGDYEWTAPMSILGKGIFHSTPALADYSIKLCEIFNLDGFVWAYPFSCRAIIMTPLITKKIMEKEGIPVLVLECDYYDSRDYSAQQLRTRVETFAEMLKARKAARV